ncbi:hypothetical protein GPJ56_005668 [Histomonas meleagridis]|nr:hypothetical protein GPJ56_005668 [Histomonas meleagridis]
MIPFFETENSKEFLKWCTNWNQSEPCCLLVGKTSSGKSRIIETIAFNLKLHIIEIDCASISGLKELIANATEATKSHSVGGFIDHTEIDYTKLSSIVVFEHIDALIQKPSQVTKGVLDLLFNTRIPIVMTSYINPFNQSKKLKVIYCNPPEDPFGVLSSSLWMVIDKSHKKQLSNILKFSNFDIRKTALQFQVGPDVRDLVPPDIKFYLSIPQYIFEEERNEREIRDMYMVLTDLLISIDPEDQICKQYHREIDDTFDDLSRKNEIEEVYQIINENVPMSRLPPAEFEEVAELIHTACEFPLSPTRRTMKPCLSGETHLRKNEILHIQSIDLWPDSMDLDE